MHKIIVVKAAYDADAGVWWVEGGDIEGLNLEADSLEELLHKLPGAITDLLEASGDDEYGKADVPIEVIAHATTRLRLSA
jgi:hypothetical protein